MRKGEPDSLFIFPVSNYSSWCPQMAQLKLCKFSGQGEIAFDSQNPRKFHGEDGLSVAGVLYSEDFNLFRMYACIWCEVVSCLYFLPNT